MVKLNCNLGLLGMIFYSFQRSLNMMGQRELDYVLFLQSFFFLAENEVA